MRSLIFDCETTGLTAPSIADLEKQPRIIELACIVAEDGVVKLERDWLINPEQPITEEITKITKLTNEDVAGKPTFKEILPELRPLFAGIDQVFAHNATFDVACMQYELKRAGCNDFNWPDVICTVSEYAHEFGFRPNLMALYERKIGKPLEQKHRALSDVQALVEILLKEGLV